MYENLDKRNSNENTEDVTTKCKKTAESVVPENYDREFIKTSNSVIVTQFFRNEYFLAQFLKIIGFSESFKFQNYKVFSEFFVREKEFHYFCLFHFYGVKKYLGAFEIKKEKKRTLDFISLDSRIWLITKKKESSKT